MKTIGVSVIVPTAGRPEALAAVLRSLASDAVQPTEVVVVDAGQNDFVDSVPNAKWELRRIQAGTRGAAIQRNEGVAAATQDVVWFIDDDAILEPGCTESLWEALQSSAQIGGVSAMIANQSYHAPGFVSRSVFCLLHGRDEKSFAGRVIGPAVNLLPEDNDALPEVVAVEWLNTTCTMYRREALPTPAFDNFFTDYSLMEDLALSLRVAKRGWKLANVRSARIYHDSQSGSIKADVVGMAAMELVNRHYVMTQVMRQRRFLDYLRLFVWEMFQLSVCALRSTSRDGFLKTCKGKWRGIKQIRSAKSLMG